jgi:hypothetical protein
VSDLALGLICLLIPALLEKSFFTSVKKGEPNGRRAQ